MKYIILTGHYIFTINHKSAFGPNILAYPERITALNATYREIKSVVVQRNIAEQLSYAINIIRFLIQNFKYTEV